MWNARTVADFRRKLLNWYRLYHRKLPWRSNISPYRVWVSEIMLQQTQINTVLPYYKRFLMRFPDIKALARAPETEVLRLWAGLGYYSRARNLHKAAHKIMDTHRSFPEDFDQILALPGVGRYTAGAICSIAFNQPYPIVDGNIRRVLARLHGLPGKVADGFFWKAMSALVPDSNPSSFNQAMMELGALVCIPAQPRCTHCPVKAQCKARKLGMATSIPAVQKKLKPRKIRVVLVVMKQNGKLLISAAGKGDLIPGSWGIPWHTLGNNDSPEETALSICRESIGATARLDPCGSIRHSITSNQITGLLYLGKLDSTVSEPPVDGFRWVDQSTAERLLTSSFFHKALGKLKKSNRGTHG